MLSRESLSGVRLQKKTIVKDFLYILKATGLHSTSKKYDHDVFIRFFIALHYIV